jgi:hypothetical protein
MNNDIKLIETHRDNLKMLVWQKSQFDTGDIPLRIINGIALVEAEISGIEKKLLVRIKLLREQLDWCDPAEVPSIKAEIKEIQNYFSQKRMEQETGTLPASDRPMTNVSEPDLTRRFFETFRYTPKNINFQEGPMRSSLREHDQARQELAAFMLGFADLGYMEWFEFERSDQLSDFLNEKGLRIERGLTTLSGTLYNVYYGEGLVGYSHISSDTFVIGVKL